MDNNQAKNEVMRLLRKNNWYGIVWYGHFFNKFVILECNSKHNRHGKVYSAVYEMFYDLVGSDTIVLTVKFGEELIWKDVLNEMIVKEVEVYLGVED